MKLNKVSVNINIETSSIQTTRGLLMELIEMIENGKVEGSVRYDDGDEITWLVKTKEVEC